MSDLNFRIVIVPKTEYTEEDNDNLLLRVKGHLQMCDLKVLSLSYFKIAKSEEDDNPEIEELVFQVIAKAGDYYPKQKLSQYEFFYSKWKEYSYSLPCSYIMVYTDNSFLRPRTSRIEVKCRSLGFGVLAHDGVFREYACLNAYGNTMNFFRDTRNVVMKHSDFEVLFSYDNIRNVIVNIQSSPKRVFFDLFNPPLINQIENRISRSRVPYNLKHRNLDLKSFNCMIDGDVLGRANVLCLSLETNENSELESLVSNIHFQCSEKPIFYSCISTVNKNKPSDFQIPIMNMEFDCLYLMTAIFRRNFVLMEQTVDIHSSLSKVSHLSNQNPKALEKSLTDVLLALDSGKMLNFWNAIQDRYNYYTRKECRVDFKDYIVPSKCCMTRRITLTPTRQLLWPKEVLLGNRVLRNYDSDFAIRVSFRDDNMLKLSFVAFNAANDFLESSISKPMTNGIHIGLRHYEFLAWSNSQIRDHGVWMYARDLEGRTAADIRKWMGNFSHIHNVPKYMARMGQCFSQTEVVSVLLDSQFIETLPDIEGGHDPENNKPYCFSDGIGKISLSLADKVHNELGHDTLCTAFQIRFGGYKGMLAIDPSLRNDQIVFRNSMKKFDCPNSRRLEIAQTSSPIPLKLNRPFIAILDDLGVRHRVFLRLQENMLKNLTDMLFDEEKAVECLKANNAIGICNYEELSRSGIHLTTEPFFRNVLLAFHRHEIDCLKTKANVAIDPKYGRNMFGVLDETGILNYGEVFVQYSTDISYGETTRETSILKGEVLVTKNPCHYPGDVRKFQAVDVPALHHHVDTIVFPQRGNRPHPSEMSGSDLDGDEYYVIWLPELLFYGLNKPPAHFPSSKSPDVHNITVNDMIRCLQKYIKEDQIGQISSAHLAHADNHTIFSAYCLSIARKASIAVDFAKTGNVLPLSRDERPKEYPDFMENNFRQKYKSHKALGKMYRICRDYETENEQATVMYQAVTVDPDLVFPGWETYKADAITMRNKYSSILGSLLRNYGIEHECEVISGAFTKLHCRFQERKDRLEIQKVILVCLKKLKQTMLEEFLEEFKNCGDVAFIENAVLQKASAWYVVTYSDPDAKFLSFPWVVSRYLSDIKIRRNLGRIPPFSPAIMKLDEKMAECESNNLLPDFVETAVWSEYRILCKPQVVKLALRVLVLWAQDEEIVELPGRHKGLLYTDTFIKLFLHVAELCKYVVSKKSELSHSNTAVFSSGKLCLEFLKFCSSLRFYKINDIHEVLPFKVYKHSKLAKRAVVSYHKFALSGIFRNLYFDRQIKEDLIEMKPFPIDSRIFSLSPITEASLQTAADVLKKYSNVDDIRLREELLTKKVWICARGSECSLKELKAILRKKHVFLRQLFQSDVMPETTYITSFIGGKRKNEAEFEENAEKKAKMFS